MTTCSARLAAIAVAVFACANAAHAATIGFFAFNGLTSGGAYTSYSAAADVGSGTVSLTSPGGTSFSGTTLNTESTFTNPSGAANSSLAIASGTSNVNNGSAIFFSFVNTGTFANLNFSYATQASSASAFTTQTLAYALAATPTAYVTVGSVTPPSGAFGVRSFDLSTISDLQFAPAVTFRLTFTGASGASNLNNRIDNALLTGTAGSPTAVPLPPAAIAGTALLGVVGFLKRRRPLASV